MSINQHRNRIGNIGKIKYFLPGPRKTYQTRQTKSYIQSRAPTRKQSAYQQNQKFTPIVDMKPFSKTDISFEVLGVSDININKQTKLAQLKQSKQSESKKLFKMFPQGQERQDFLKFVEGLKQDQNYQNTITMFTIMYYYQKKTGEKMNSFL